MQAVRKGRGLSKVNDWRNHTYDTRDLFCLKIVREKKGKKKKQAWINHS